MKYIKSFDTFLLESKEFDSEGYSYENYYSLTDPDISVKKTTDGNFVIFKGNQCLGFKSTLGVARKKADELHKST